MGEDDGLDLIRRRRLLEMQRRALMGQAPASKRSVEDEGAKRTEEALKDIFVGRAWEVWYAAKQQYPQAAEQVANAIASAWLSGRLREKVTGEQLYWLFQSVGLPVRLQTQIRILEGGELKSIAEKLKEK
jgi:DNA-binding TFAR19-related protein (PDSD5 family)